MPITSPAPERLQPARASGPAGSGGGGIVPLRDREPGTASADAPTSPSRSDIAIAILAIAGIAVHLSLRAAGVSAWMNVPLWAVLAAGGVPLVIGLARKLLSGQFGSDLLAGLSIATAAVLDEPLAGSIVVLMLSGGEALEILARTRASSVLHALAQRMPSRAHRLAAAAPRPGADPGSREAERIDDIPLDAVAAGDLVVVFPHEICPVDGVVVEGHGVMDESYLTGEPFLMSKAPGSTVVSGAINGDRSVTVRATRRAVDSRYAQIMQVMRESSERRPRMRRLADQLGAAYTPVALGVAIAAAVWSRDPMRFLAVLVVATPCPLLIAIPIALVGSISLAAKRSIIIRDPAVLERLDRCRTVVLDKTGTLTYGAPSLERIDAHEDVDENHVLQLAASLERFSKHPLARPILDEAEARQLPLLEVVSLSERPGEGLTGLVGLTHVTITGRRQAAGRVGASVLPPVSAGLECVVLLDGEYAASFEFRDAPRLDSRSFIRHLGPRHQVQRVLIVSGDREAEVHALAARVGVTEVYAAQTPEQKVAITRRETERAPTLFVGDGINDAPALATATVGIAFGHQSEITTAAAGAVIMDSALKRVDELFHIARRTRRIALQSAVGGMALSLVGMIIAAAGALTPVAGAVFQEVVDLGAVLNALRAAIAREPLSDYPAATEQPERPLTR